MTFTYETLPASGTCLEPIVATTTGSHAPAIGSPAAPCFWASLGTVAVDLFGASVPLHDAQIGAQFTGDPPTGLASGLSMGFLREADADQILIPGSVPLVGGQPLSSVLPGGTGNCAAHDDRDTWNAEAGWWVYFNFVASPVTFVGR